MGACPLRRQMLSECGTYKTVNARFKTVRSEYMTVKATYKTVKAILHVIAGVRELWGHALFVVCDQPARPSTVGNHRQLKRVTLENRQGPWRGTMLIWVSKQVFVNYGGVSSSSQLVRFGWGPCAACPLAGRGLGRRGEREGEREREREREGYNRLRALVPIQWAM